MQMKMTESQAVEEASHVHPIYMQTDSNLQWSQPILQSHLECITFMCSSSGMLLRTTTLNLKYSVTYYLDLH